MAQIIRTAVFPLGQDRRLACSAGATAERMLSANGKPLIKYAVEEARDSGVEQFVFVDGGCRLRNSLVMSRAIDLDRVRDWLPASARLAYTWQEHAQGLAHALWCVRNLIDDDPFAVLLADDLVLADTPCLAQMQEAYRRVGGNIVAVKAPFAGRGPHASCADRERLVAVRGFVDGLVLHSGPATLSAVGRCILQPRVALRCGPGEGGLADAFSFADLLHGLSGSASCWGYRFEGQCSNWHEDRGRFDARVSLGDEGMSGEQQRLPAAPLRTSPSTSP